MPSKSIPPQMRSSGTVSIAEKPMDTAQAGDVGQCRIHSREVQDSDLVGDQDSLRHDPSYDRGGICRDCGPDGEREAVQQQFFAEEDKNHKDFACLGQQQALRPPYTDGTSRITMVNDGTKNCLALLLTENIVSKICEIGREIRALEEKEDLFRDIDMDVFETQALIGGLRAVLKHEDREQSHVHRELDRQISKLHKFRQQRDSLAEELEILRINNQNSRDQSQKMFEQVLRESCLLELEGPESQTAAEAHRADMLPEGSATVSIYNASPAPSLGEIQRRTAYSDMMQGSWDLANVRSQFDNRQEEYDYEKAEWEKAIAEGRCTTTRTDFDCWMIERVRGLTRDLIDSEEFCKDARAHARAVGVPVNGFDQTSDFMDRDDDGYRASKDASEMVRVDRDRIQAWRDVVSVSQDLSVSEDFEPVAVDEWDARSVDLTDSISVVDHQGHSKRIKRWREIGESLRGGEGLDEDLDVNSHKRRRLP